MKTKIKVTSSYIGLHERRAHIMRLPKVDGLDDGVYLFVQESVVKTHKFIAMKLISWLAGINRYYILALAFHQLNARSISIE